MQIHKHKTMKMSLGISFICLIFFGTACMRYENKAGIFENTMNEKTVGHKVCEKKTDVIRASYANRIYLIENTGNINHVDIINSVDVNSGAGAENIVDIVNEVDIIENTVNINLSR